MTWERKSGRFAGYKADDGPGLPPPLGSLDGYDVTGKKSWKAFTPRFALNWKATDDVLLYGSIARGYKSGGFQGLSGTAEGASTDRKSVVEGKSVSVRVDLGGSRILTNNNKNKKQTKQRLKTKIKIK